ncbi:hypothetical protein [Carbonactinospora thermoautotrophica]|uniref:hypothetical protein n=1 Tax=Carbonactinospora thermoautotrophica TaxID=1469144 RepID=UPI00227107B6|nr:hypothetical protein [Carbonactinospora thermoautotrophica]
MSYEKLPLTGAGITVGGVFFEQVWLLVAAAGLIAMGALMIRLGWRRNKGISQA